MKRVRPCFVYFVRRADGEGPVKIGCSEYPENRMSSLMAWAPYPLAVLATIPGDESLERRFHALFRHDHSHREWFRPSAELDAVIAQVAAGSFDVETLPQGKRIQSTVRPPWPEVLKARTRASNAVWRLKKSGVAVPEHVLDCRYGFWGASAAEQWARVKTMTEWATAQGAPPNPPSRRRSDIAPQDAAA